MADLSKMTDEELDRELVWMRAEAIRRHSDAEDAKRVARVVDRYVRQLEAEEKRRTLEAK